MISPNFKQDAFLAYQGLEYSEKTPFIKEFLHYIEAYSAELKISETDIFTNDKLFDTVYHLFDVVILQKKLQFNEN